MICWCVIEIAINDGACSQRRGKEPVPAGILPRRDQVRDHRVRGSLIETILCGGKPAEQRGSQVSLDAGKLPGDQLHWIAGFCLCLSPQRERAPPRPTPRKFVFCHGGSRLYGIGTSEFENGGKSVGSWTGDRLESE